MTWSPQAVESKIEQLVSALESRVADLDMLAKEAGKHKARYKVEFAKAMLLARRELGRCDDEERKAFALNAVAQVETRYNGELVSLVVAHEVSEVAFQAARGGLEGLRTEGDLLRTMLVQARGVQDPRPRS